MGETRKLLSVVEAAELLGIGRSHMYGLIARGEITSINIGKSRRIPTDAIDNFISKKVAEAVTDESIPWSTAVKDD